MGSYSIVKLSGVPLRMNVASMPVVPLPDMFQMRCIALTTSGLQYTGGELACPSDTTEKHTTKMMNTANRAATIAALYRMPAVKLVTVMRLLSAVLRYPVPLG